MSIMERATLQSFSLRLRSVSTRYPVTKRSPGSFLVRRPPIIHREYASPAQERPNDRDHGETNPSSQSRTPSPSQSTSSSAQSNRPNTQSTDWDDNPNMSISAFSELPSSDFGVNQHMIINQEFKEALRQILWQFRAPIRYAFAYGSGVFPQSASSTASSSSSSPVHAKPSQAIIDVQRGGQKMIDFIFGVSYTQHWHSLNLHQHRDHYSGVGSLGSYVVSTIQDKWGAGVYYNPYVTVNGTLIKYGVVNLDTLCTDLNDWTTLYLAGRLQKPVKILRDDPRVRYANQRNLLSAIRTALLLLPETFTEREFYSTIASISYMGDPRNILPTENPRKISNIVSHNLPNFRRLYASLVGNLPNVSFNDSACSRPEWADDPNVNARLEQDMDPRKRGNMVRRLPDAFRQKLYFAFQSRYKIPRAEFNEMIKESTEEKKGGGSSSDAGSARFKRPEGGVFEQRIGRESPDELRTQVSGVIRKTIGWPSTSQTAKGIMTAGVGRSWRYVREKRAKYKEGMKKE